MKTAISLRPFRRGASVLVVLLLGATLSSAGLASVSAQSAGLKARVLDDSIDVAQAAVGESIEIHDVMALRAALKSRYLWIQRRAAEALGQLDDLSAVPD